MGPRMTVVDNGEGCVIETRNWCGDMEDAEDAGNAKQGRRRKGVEETEKHGRVRKWPSQKEEADCKFLSPQHAHAEDNCHRAGDEERQRKEIDPPHPEHGRQLGRQQEHCEESRTHQRESDDVVGLSVVNCRLRL